MFESSGRVAPLSKMRMPAVKGFASRSCRCTAPKAVGERLAPHCYSVASLCLRVISRECDSRGRASCVWPMSYSGVHAMLRSILTADRSEIHRCCRHDCPSGESGVAGVHDWMPMHCASRRQSSESTSHASLHVGRVNTPRTINHARRAFSTNCVTTPATRPQNAEPIDSKRQSGRRHHERDERRFALAHVLHRVGEAAHDRAEQRQRRDGHDQRLRQRREQRGDGRAEHPASR